MGNGVGNCPSCGQMVKDLVLSNAYPKAMKCRGCGALACETCYDKAKHEQGCPAAVWDNIEPSSVDGFLAR